MWGLFTVGPKRPTCILLMQYEAQPKQLVWHLNIIAVTCWCICIQQQPVKVEATELFSYLINKCGYVMLRGPHHVCIATSDANTSKSISLSNFCPGELASSGTFCTSKQLHPSNACWIKCGKPPEIGFGKSFPPSSHEEQATCTCVQGSTAWVDSITQVLWKMPVDMLVDAGGI